MIRQHFVAACSSQHRTAVLALYRALLRTGSNVSLPHHLHPNGKKHPITKILRERFAKNKPLTSFRLLYNSMAAGYKFLTILKKGQDAKSPEHSEILRHLQKRNATANLSRTNSPSLKKPPRSKQRLNPPLLTKVSALGEPAKYEPTIRPLPKTAFVGERKVPVSGHTAEFLPFVRIKKPTPRIFSRAVGRKTKIFRQSVITFLGVSSEDIPMARSEDHWDAMMDKLLRKEGVTEEVERVDPSPSYHFTATLSKAWWDQKLHRYRNDWTARGEAVSRLIEQERALVKEEKDRGAEPTDPEIAKETLDTILSDYRQRHVDLERTKDADDATTFQDPFLSPKWMAKAQRLEREYINKYAGRVDESGERVSRKKGMGSANKEDSLLKAVESDDEAQFFSHIAAMRRGRQPRSVLP
ncbi:hypothetical protein FBEOM_10829 [Fusarium beomiforme]|uniref:Complex 1 LYR protein domain-containing protein n=1 Tax=Fusarium beomiforme TaxID=44412 RepID=A0A9P5ABQ5_9HYPO|nr:hypothetical protein FBEOM_10829 [Fusarium beomiforme]